MILSRSKILFAGNNSPLALYLFIFEIRLLGINRMWRRSKRSFPYNVPAPTVACCGLCLWTVELVPVVLLCCAFIPLSFLQQHPPVVSTPPPQLAQLHSLPPLSSSDNHQCHCKYLVVLSSYTELLFNRPPALYNPRRHRILWIRWLFSIPLLLAFYLSCLLPAVQTETTYRCYSHLNNHP